MTPRLTTEPRALRRISSAELQELVSPKRSKFNVNNSAAGKLARTYGGRCFDSLAEAKYAMELDIRKRAGHIQDWWPQVPILLTVNGVRVGKMVADFKVLHNNEQVEHVEIKGMELPVWKLKLKLMRALYPDLWYTVIKA